MSSRGSLPTITFRDCIGSSSTTRGVIEHRRIVMSGVRHRARVRRLLEVRSSHRSARRFELPISRVANAGNKVSAKRVVPRGRWGERVKGLHVTRSRSARRCRSPLSQQRPACHRRATGVERLGWAVGPIPAVVGASWLGAPWLASSPLARFASLMDTRSSRVDVDVPFAPLGPLVTHRKALFG